MAGRKSKLPHAPKNKLSKRLTIAFAVISLLTFIFKEVLQANLKDLHDSLTTAEAQYRTESNQTDISLQILGTQQQLEVLIKHPPNDYSALIREDEAHAREAEAHVNEYFDEVSRFIEKLPSGARDVRAAQEQVRKSIEQMHHTVDEDLKPTPDHGVARFARGKVVVISALVEGIPVAILADTALTRAHQIEHAAEVLMPICAWITYILGAAAVILGVYAAAKGLNAGAHDAE